VVADLVVVALAVVVVVREAAVPSSPRWRCSSWSRVPACSRWPRTWSSAAVAVRCSLAVVTVVVLEAAGPQSRRSRAVVAVLAELAVIADLVVAELEAVQLGTGATGPARRDRAGDDRGGGGGEISHPARHRPHRPGPAPVAVARTR
jgi:hypothetical protein